MFKLKIYVIFYLIPLCLATGTMVEIEKNVHNCWLAVSKYYFKYTINVALYFNKTLGGKDDLPIHKTYYKSDLSNFYNLLKQLKSHVEAPNSFIFLNPNEHDLEEALTIIQESKSPYIFAEYFVIVSNKWSAYIVAEILYKFNLYYSIIIWKEAFYVINARGKSSKAKYLGECDLINSRIEEIRKYSQLYPKNASVNVIWTRHIPVLIDSNETLSGIKIDALKAFEKSSAVKLVYRPPDSTYLDEMVTTYTFNSVQRAFETNYAEMFLGPANLEVAQMFDAGPVLWANTFYYFIPKPVKNTYLTGIFSFFSPLGWTVVFLLFALWTKLFMVLTKQSKDQKRYRTFTGNLLMFYNFSLGLPYSVESYKALVPRFLIISFLIASVQLTTFVQGRLFSKLTGKPYGSSINTLKELVDSDIPIHLPDPILILYPDKSDPVVIKLMKKYVSRNIDNFVLATQSLKDKKFATLTDTGFLLMHPLALETHSIFEMLAVKQTAAMKRNHYLTKYIFTRMERIVESGIVDKYTKLYKFKYFLRTETETETSEFNITVKKLSGVFIVYGTGIIISICTFIGETVIKLKIGIKY